MIRPYLLARREGLNPTSAFATIMLERLLDLVTVLLLFAVFVFTVGPGVISGDPGQLARVKVGGGWRRLAAVAGVAVFFALAGHPERLGRAALRIERVLPARLARIVAGFVETFAQGLAVHAPSGPAARVARAVVSDVDVDRGRDLAVVAGISHYVSLSGFVPRDDDPGRRRRGADARAIGGFHAAYMFAVTTFFGVETDRAAAAALVLHAISFVPVTLLGIVFMMREGLTLAGARRLAKEAPGGDGPRRSRSRRSVILRERGTPGSSSRAGSARRGPRGEERRAMKCPYCGNLGDKVVDSRESKEGDVIRRRRECLGCAKRFTSRERIEDIEYRVVKKDGNREAFQRQKLIAGLLTACEKRPVSVQQLEAIADRVESELQERPSGR